MTPKLKARLAKARPTIEAGNYGNASYDDLAKRLKVTRTTVSNYCRYLGIILHNKLTRNRSIDYAGWSAKVDTMRKQGMNQTEIAKALGVSPATITKWKHKR
jgi:transposase